MEDDKKLLGEILSKVTKNNEMLKTLVERVGAVEERTSENAGQIARIDRQVGANKKKSGVWRTRLQGNYTLP